MPAKSLHMQRFGLLWLAFSVVMLNAAHAQTASQKEARSFLAPCAEAAPGDEKLCAQNQKTFLALYADAEKGWTGAMETLARAFEGAWWPEAPDYVRQRMVGLPTQPIEGCAWRIVKLAKDPDPSWRVSNQQLLESAASRLTAPEQRLCDRRAEQLLTRLRSVRGHHD